MIHLRRRPFRIKKIVVENRGFRHAQLVLRASLKQGVPELPEDDPFDTPGEALSEPLGYLFDLATPGYVVEFTWRTDMVRLEVRGVFFGSAVEEAGAHESFYGSTSSPKRAPTRR